ncbi:hypothetical protein GINT2_001690 [Glugoides intestinalis]
MEKKTTTKKRNETILAGVVVAAAVCYITAKFFKTKSVREATIAHGMACFGEQKYTEALTHFTKVSKPDFNVLEKIFECHERLGNTTNALLYLNKCISLNRSESLIIKRFNAHTSLEMNKEAFKDLFLINLICKDEKYKEKTAEFLKKTSSQLARSFKIKGFASSINYTDFFDTLFFLKDIQDPAVVFLNSGEFEKCFEYVKSSTEELHKLLFGCFCLVNADFANAVKAFEKLTSPYSKILLTFIRSKKLATKDINALKERILTETDPTILLYIAKIFEGNDERTSQFDALEKCLVIYPNSCAACSLIVWYIRQKNKNEAQSLIDKSLKSYPNSINLVCIALEYYTISNNIDSAVTLLEQAERVFVRDPRIFLFKYTISEALGNPDKNFLLQGIEADPKYFKLYIYLGNTSQTGEESADAYRKALGCARSYEEIFTAYQLLIVIETQNELFKEYPDLFIEHSS